MFRKVIASSRYIVSAASLGAFVASALLLIVALGQLIITVASTLANFASVLADPKELTQVLVTNIDLFLLSAGFYIIGLGFYELFVDAAVPVPEWLEITDFEDLKASLVGIVVVVIAVAFLGQVLDWKGGVDIFYFGAAVGLVIAALTYFVSVKAVKAKDRRARRGRLARCADLLPRQLLQRLHQGVIALATQAALLQGAIVLEDERRGGQGDAQLVGRLQHQPQIFLLQVDGETRPPVAPDDLRAAVVEHPAAGRAAANGRQRPLQIQPARLGQQQRLAHGLHGDDDEHLVDQLGQLARALAADVGDRLAHRLQHGHGPRHLFGVAADHDAERTPRRALAAAANRGVEHVDAALGQPGGDGPAGFRADGAAIDDQRARPRPGQHAVAPEDDGLHVGRVADADDEDVAAAGHIGGVVADGRAGLCQGVMRLGVRFQTVTSKPAFNKLAAIAPPMIPSPMKPTFSFMGRIIPD